MPTSRPTYQQGEDPTTQNCSCARCSAMRRTPAGPPTWYPVERQDPRHFGVSSLYSDDTILQLIALSLKSTGTPYPDQGQDVGVGNRAETAMTVPNRALAPFTPMQTARAQDNYSYAPAHERAGPPNTGFPRSPTFDESIAESRRRLAGRYLNNPDAYSQGLHGPAQAARYTNLCTSGRCGKKDHIVVARSKAGRENVAEIRVCRFGPGSRGGIGKCLLLAAVPVRIYYFNLRIHVYQFVRNLYPRHPLPLALNFLEVDFTFVTLSFNNAMYQCFLSKDGLQLGATRGSPHCDHCLTFNRIRDRAAPRTPALISAGFVDSTDMTVELFISTCINSIVVYFADEGYIASMRVLPQLEDVC
ncbi:hypothetical protein EDB86DRAFT_2833560 [Lactarius hatsudake]|nr:hypothetical protein EDB86DRAFT_2833560 [Lactarius hatsudake]